MILMLDTFLMKPESWFIPWILRAVAYYFVLKKMGLRYWTAAVPFLAEREMSTVLFRRMRTFYRPFIISAVFMAGAYYLGPEEKLGYAYMMVAYVVYSLFLLTAAGCHLILFTTGRGTPTGNAIVPVLKVTANEHTYSWMEDNMDVDLSGIIRGEQTIEESGGMLLEKLHEIANGKLTKAEAYGFSDIAVDHVCRFV